MGRPSKLDDLTAKRIVDAVARGLPRRTAARIAGVVPSTLALWLQKGRAGDSGYSDFSDRVAAAEARGEDELMGYMREHAKVSHAACCWLLERRNPKDYALRKPAEATAKPTGVVTSPEEQEALLVSLLAAVRSDS